MKRLFMLLICATTNLFAEPLETVFTYQGELQQDNVLADGTFDFEFRLFDMASSGTEIVPAIVVDDLAVSDGIFTTELDFGMSPFNGEQLWLQISVREGASVGGFTQLLPRTKITATPFALNAVTVAMDAISSTQIADGSIGSADIDSTQIQSRISASCPPGSSIRVIDVNGNVTCEDDDTGGDLAGVLCPPEQVVVGFQGNGQPACAPSSNVGGACPINASFQLVQSSKLDLIIVADNSGSMAAEHTALETELNNMAAALDGLNSDYRFIMVTNHGPNSTESCIPQPLSGTVDCTMPAVSGPRFFHYDVDVLSQNSLCIALDAFTGGEPDESGRYSTGYQSLLRPDAYKAFIELTDDGVQCSSSETGISLDDNDNVNDGETAAGFFEQALTGFYPEQFGTSENPRYGFYSIVGVPPNGPADAPYTSVDNVTTSMCISAADPGTGYQWLSKNTESLWFSQCETASYGSILDQIAMAADAVAGGNSTCSFTPEVPTGRTLDLDAASLVFTPGVGVPQNLTMVANSGACTGDEYYFGPGETLTLCPAICTTVQSDTEGSLELDIPCEWPP